MDIKVYDFYNQEYGIKLQLILDDKKKRLKYQCFSIKDEYRGNFRYECSNGWSIVSIYCPNIRNNEKALLLCGTVTEKENNICINITAGKPYYVEINNSDLYFIFYMSYKDIEQMYHGLIEALNELGNDYNEAEMFLDM